MEAFLLGKISFVSECACIYAVWNVYFFMEAFLPLMLVSDALPEFVSLEASELHAVGC